MLAELHDLPRRAGDNTPLRRLLQFHIGALVTDFVTGRAMLAAVRPLGRADPGHTPWAHRLPDPIDRGTGGRKPASDLILCMS